MGREPLVAELFYRIGWRNSLIDYQAIHRATRNPGASDKPATSREESSAPRVQSRAPGEPESPETACLGQSNSPKPQAGVLPLPTHESATNQIDGELLHLSDPLGLQKTYFACIMQIVAVDGGKGEGFRGPEETYTSPSHAAFSGF